MAEGKPINWSWVSGGVAAGIFIVSSAIGYGALKQDVANIRNDMSDVRTEVKELRRSFVDFLTNQPKRTAQR